MGSREKEEHSGVREWEDGMKRVGREEEEKDRNGEKKKGRGERCMWEDW